MTEKNNGKSMWDISTDIYKIVNSVDNLKKRYIDEDETTLALGLPGFIGDLEAKKIQSAIIQTGELGNEMLPSRAKLDKNILTHAVYQNISDINAEPSYIVATLGIKVSDLDKFMIDDRFIFDRECPIYVGDYEFHFDYDVILERSKSAQMSSYIYAARYDMENKNLISKVDSPYLKQPFLVNMLNKKYIVFQATLRQVTLEWTSDRLITNSIIDNKTFIFNFTNQLADFVVYVTENGKTTRIVPIFYGAPVDPDIETYCWYLYLNDHSIRITFDAASFIPGLNADVTIEAQTTLGLKGNFPWDKEQGLFTDFTSEKYGYNNITCYLLPLTDGYDGRDRKSTEELHEIIPKYALSRGYLTTERDLDNYFNLINTKYHKLKLQKKVDNQLERIWYAYLLIKDHYGNIIPTNTVDITINTNDPLSCFESEDGRMIVPSGTYFSFDPETRMANVIDEAMIPELYSDEYFSDQMYYYVSVFNIAICKDPLYVAFYMTNVNRNSYFIYDWVNDDCNLQFVANRNHIERKLLTERNVYKFSFSMSQSVSDDFRMYYEKDEVIDGKYVTKIINNMKCFLVIYRKNVPYRWVELELTSFDYGTWTSTWEIELETDNGLDMNNYIKLLNLGVIGSATEKNYGYFEPSPKAFLYTCAKFEDGKEYGRYDIGSVIPGIDEYSVTNKYEIEGGLHLFYNFSYMMNTRIKADGDNVFEMTAFPMVGAHYMIDEEYVGMFLEALNSKRAYIERCLALLENSMTIDLKFFNCYGPSITFNIGDKQKTLINHVDIEMKFRAKLRSASDMQTKQKIIEFVKEQVENISDIGTLHIPNLIADLDNNFNTVAEYIEYMNFNKFWLGVQHIVLEVPDDPHIVPEFICIRNKFNEETGLLEPCIEIECTSY